MGEIGRDSLGGQISHILGSDRSEGYRNQCCPPFSIIGPCLRDGGGVAELAIRSNGERRGAPKRLGYAVWTSQRLAPT